MAQDQFKRKLTTIFSADVAGYSRLMGEDEASTVKTLEQYKQAMSELIRQHRGRVIDSPGDNLLAEFSSVVDSVQCAVAIQKALQAHNAELPENRQMQFRIGVNLGDVIEEESKIYGDGVNIAARLEKLADPGGICISKTAFDHIESKLPYGYDYIGDQTVKNIAKPVGVYRVQMEPRVTIGRKKELSTLKRLRRLPVFVGVAGIVVVVMSIGAWFSYLRRPSIETASVDRMAYSLPDKPSIAVLPFANLSDSPDKAYIADGISDNIINALSKLQEIFVIAKKSVSIYKNAAIKIQQVSEDLGVQHILEGSVQSSGNRLRVMVQLIDATRGHLLWSENYDREIKSLFDIQDEITKEIVVALQVKLSEGEQAQIRHRSTDNLQAWGNAVKGYSLFENYNKVDNAKARELFEEAIKLDPEYSWAWTWLAWTHWIDARFGFSNSRSESFKKAVEVAKKSYLLDETDPDIHALMGAIHLFQREHNKALEEGTKSISLGPSNAENHALLAMTMVHSAIFEDAVNHSQMAMRLSPYYPAWYLAPNGAAKYFLRRYEEATEAFKLCLERSLKDRGAILIYAYIYLAAIYAETGQIDEAHNQIEEAQKINSNLSLEWVEKATFQRDQMQLQRWLEALRKAGLK